MKFMLLVHHDETAFAALDDATKADMLAKSIQLCHRLHADGQYLGASPLQTASTAAIVRVRDAKPFVTDGPFVETKEQVAGYFLIEARSREEAIAIAVRVPGARIGTIEVRPLREVSGLPETK
jgi:hypothetical protein